MKVPSRIRGPVSSYKPVLGACLDEPQTHRAGMIVLLCVDIGRLCWDVNRATLSKLSIAAAQLPVISMRLGGRGENHDARTHLGVLWAALQRDPSGSWSSPSRADPPRRCVLGGLTLRPSNGYETELSAPAFYSSVGASRFPVWRITRFPSEGRHSLVSIGFRMSVPGRWVSVEGLTFCEIPRRRLVRRLISRVASQGNDCRTVAFGVKAQSRSNITPSSR